ncbi:MAG: hypothetical protein KGM47_00010 [Acidobacteriota bacterium]|nr:hypothetical protein [Acidobacteriota bacterium]
MRVATALILLEFLFSVLAVAQVETAPSAPTSYLWQHELHVEGHLALSYSPDGAFSPDGSTLAVVENRRVVLINLTNGHAEKVINISLPGISDLEIQSANFIASNRLFILASGVVKSKHGERVPELAFQWDIVQNALASKLDSVGAGGGFLPVRYFPRIDYLALYKDSQFTVWSPVTGRAASLTVPELKHPPLLFAFSPDGHWLLLAQIETNSTPNPVVVLLRQHQFVNVLPGHQGAVLSMTFSHDGKMLETSCQDGKVRIWSVPDWKLLETLTGNLGPVHWAEFSPDGSLVASAGEDGSVRIWDTATGKLLQTLEESRHPLLTVAFSPNGRYLAASSQNDVHVWARTPVE